MSVGSRRFALAAGVMVPLLLGACGGGDGSSAPGAQEPADSPAADSPGSSETRCASFDEDCQEVLPPDTVDLRGILFRPDTIEIDAGTTVTFDNVDPVRHTVTAGTPSDPGGERFDVDLAAGDTTTVTFDEPGEVVYFCRVHPQTMQGTVSVEPA